MKVSNDLITNSIVPAVKPHCRRNDDKAFPPVADAIGNVFHYINYLNSNIIEGQTILDKNNLSDMMIPSGLAEFLEPVAVRLDSNNTLNPDLKNKFNCSEDEKKLPANYSYFEFINDIKRICTAMNCGDPELNTSVAQAVRAIDVHTVVDKLLVDGHVKYSGIKGEEFIPLELVSGFTYGYAKEPYCVELEDMMKQYFVYRIKEIFAK
jgi:hypothetical protein